MKINDITQDSLNDLNEMKADELIKWAFSRFGDRAAIGTSFQLSGSVIIDIASKHFTAFRVFIIDTLRLHPETYDIVRRIEEKYDIKIERFRPDADSLRNMVARFGEYLFFMDRAKQEYCCEIRKVEPNKRALLTLDVWITGLRRDQSDHRKKVNKAEIITQDGRSILKLCPLADWSTDEVWDYIRKNSLPYNVLYDTGYDSIGCIICSTPLVKGESPRSGRWRWFNILNEENKKECGIHI